MSTPNQPKTKRPECGSTDLSGLVAAFWTPLDTQGNANLSEVDFSSETEVGPERCCADCGHIFEAE